MQLGKTEKGRAALAGRPGALNAFDRRVLIVCDGQRNLDDVVALLGPEALGSVSRLLSEAYLSGSAARRGVLGTALSALRGGGPAVRPSPPPARPATVGGDSAPAAPRPATTTDAAASPTPRSRRSVAAAKMYVIGLLQLQRNPDAVALAATLQACREPDEIMEVIGEAQRHITATCNASYARTVDARLREVTPEELLPMLPPLAASAAAG